MFAYNPKRNPCSAVILFLSSLDSKSYLQIRQQLECWRPSCPLCGRTLARNGQYTRRLSVHGQLLNGVIFRKRCRPCRVGFSLFPSDMVPLHSHGAEVIADRLIAGLRGQGLRSLEFYRDQALAPSVFDGAWSDWLDSNPLVPTFQAFHRWQQKFSYRTQAWLRPLTWACIHAGASLREQLGPLLTGFPRCPPALNPLALGVGLLALLLRLPAETCLRLRLGFLACRPSHKSVQAFGRPPPLYGGCLECPFPQA